jgi:hypothetical protein
MPNLVGLLIECGYNNRPIVPFPKRECLARVAPRRGNFFLVKALRPRRRQHFQLRTRSLGGVALAFLRSAVGNWTWGQGPQWHGRTLGATLASSGRLSDRPWIVIVVVVDDARAVTLGTGDDVAVLIPDRLSCHLSRSEFGRDIAARQRCRPECWRLWP